MSPDELTNYHAEVLTHHTNFTNLVDSIDPASAQTESTDHKSDAYAEALFMRAFTTYEGYLEELFLHYVTGGATLQGRPAISYLNPTDRSHARKLALGGFKFLSWAKPSETRKTAEMYLEHGWPICTMLNNNSSVLTDCERIRNRIAHKSLEAITKFNTVQRNMLGTERPFPITPGQFLRIRNRDHKLYLQYYLNTMHETLEAIFNPPA